jgi:hypothetical protein
MRSAIPIIMLSLALSGCVTAQEREQQAAAEHAAREQRHASTCAAYGYKQGTEPFAQCMMNLDVAELNARAQIAAAQVAAPPSTCIRNGPVTNCF